MTTRSRGDARFNAVALATSRPLRKFDRQKAPNGQHLKSSDYFGCNVFSLDKMTGTIAQKDLSLLKEAASTNKPITLELADKVAAAVKEWALSRGATHYCHWFQPQTGATAEKHDSFLSFDEQGNSIDSFSGKQLVQSEPDASSFPSGGVRETFEARGYTAWDSSSPMFLMETENGLTLCIPSVFVSYGGDALDKKTPLLRSLAAVNKSAVEALKLLGKEDVKHVMVTVGPEQEYFVIDEAFFSQRPDLVLAHRTLLGRTPPRGQQLEDHYFGSIKRRVLNFMMEAEQELYKLGVPCKTRHNEVAPSQCEAAPIFEQANIAADHNQLTMEILRSVAQRHYLKAIFHEKPFAGVNGSGKHVNWSMSDDTGHNLLEPGENPEENIRFLYFLTATIKAVNDYSGLLRAAIASAANDFRLGANEAPPAIMSVFLGETLTEVLDRIESGGGTISQRSKEINLDLAKVPVIAKDNTDRNRTSPFAFTGNKFEFRAVGASMSISPALTSLNVAVAKSLVEMNKRLRKRSAKPKNEDILALLGEVIKETKKVRFEGNNYSQEWHEEAERRSLPNFKDTPSALQILRDEGIQAVFQELGVYTPKDLQARYNVLIERYNKIRLIELETLQELVNTHVLPAAFLQLSELGTSAKTVAKTTGTVPTTMKKIIERLASATNSLSEHEIKLGRLIKQAKDNHNETERAKFLAAEGMRALEEVRQICNEIELLVDDQLWSLPKYREMLFIL